MLRNPFNGLLNAFSKRDLWGPPNYFSRFCVIRLKFEHLALRWTEALGIRGNLGLLTEQIENQVGEFTNTDHFPCSQIDLFTQHIIICSCRSQKAIYRIRNEREISHRIQTTQPYFITCECLGNDGGNNCPCRLTGSIGIKGAQGYNWQIERMIETLRDFISTDLTGRVRRLRLKGMFFINRSILCRSIDFAGRSLDHAPDLRFPGG